MPSTHYLGHMRGHLTDRLRKVARTAKLLRYFRELAADTGKMADQFYALSSDMEKALKEGDLPLLAESIRNNRKTADQFAFISKRYDRILNTLSGDS